jgi:nucleoside-diphosphate-sugar epimerase
VPRRKFAAWAQQSQARLALVGGSGWVGMALADQALAAGFPPERMRVFTALPCLLTINGVTLQTEALDAATRLGDGAWVVAHAAIIGPDRVEGGDLVEVRARNDALMSRVFRIAGGADVRRLLMISSGAAHQTQAANPAKAAYARMKREHETEVSAWAAKAGTQVLLPRIFNLGGPYINHVGNYALGDFILSLANTGALRISAGDPVIRSYVHVLELADVLLDMAVDHDEDQTPFDIGGTQTVELGALAEAIAAELAILGTVVSRPASTVGPGDRYAGDGARYQAHLAAMGRSPVGLAQIIADTITYLRRTGAIS